MGHQVNFYATPTDLDELQRKFAEQEPLTIIHSRSPRAGPSVVHTLNVLEDGKPWLYYHLVRESDLPNVVTRHVPAQGYWTVDVLISPVIELNTCYFNGRILRRGRLYYVDGFYGADGTWVEKPVEFRSWAKLVLLATTKAFTKDGHDYVGKAAAAWVLRDNGRLVT